MEFKEGISILRLDYRFYLIWFIFTRYQIFIIDLKPKFDPLLIWYKLRKRNIWYQIFL